MQHAKCHVTGDRMKNLLGAPASRRPVRSRNPELAGETPTLPGTMPRFRCHGLSPHTQPGLQPFHRAFTLIELLVVISILGILAYLTMPALKSWSKSDATISASRQLLDDCARARQLAISQRTTVYMVFVPMNFAFDAGGNFLNNWWSGLTNAAWQTAATNLCDKQLTGYTFVSLRSVGDQPGQGVPHYLAPWQKLPDGAFIAQAKFTNSPTQYYTITDPVSGAAYNIYGFNYTNIFPFPTETSPIPANSPLSNQPYLPYIAFNYLGQLVSEVDANGVYHDGYLPLAKGSITLSRDPVTKALIFAPLTPVDVMEMPPGNSTSSSYNIIHIDQMTGRAVLEFEKVK
ncbi:MAG: prepilin-type N-terminal cleavage/methylation domain-containing protein [Verrucomicrobiia bacterium]